MYTGLRRQRAHAVHKLHQRYGSGVRVGPTELSFSNMDSVRQMHGYGTVFTKGAIHETFSLPPPRLFNMQDKKAHSKRRRLVSHVFSQSFLLESESIITEHVERLVHEQIEQGLGRPLNMLLLFRLTVFNTAGNQHVPPTMCNYLRCVQISCRLSCVVDSAKSVWPHCLRGIYFPTRTDIRQERLLNQIHINEGLDWKMRAQ